MVIFGARGMRNNINIRVTPHPAAKLPVDSMVIFGARRMRDNINIPVTPHPAAKLPVDVAKALV